MRTENSIKNVIIALISNVLTILIGFISQKVFIQTLGIEYLGINGLFTNIISMLSIMELGIGTAIIYNLYEPIAQHKIKKIKALMNFYKKSYHLIALLIFIIGLLIIPFLPNIIGKIEITENINNIYILFIIEICASYLLAYKRSVLYANQKNYYINLIHIGYLILLNVIQIALLVIFKNYYLFLIIKLIFRILENFCINQLANYRYGYLKEKNNEKLDEITKNDIIKKVKSLFLHQLGSFFINGTDNIIISSFLGIEIVGYYSNYYMIINAIITIVNQIFTSLTASVGNLLVTCSKEKIYEIFKKIRKINVWISGMSSICMYILIDLFITIWIGEAFCLNKNIVLVLCINYYLQTTKRCITIFKEAAGIFYEDRFIPLIESFVNIIVSVFLLKFYGLIGVFIGTIVSSLVLHFYSYPKYTYAKIFKRKGSEYVMQTCKYLLITIGIGIITYKITNSMIISNQYLEMIFKAVIAFAISNILFFVILMKKEDISYYKSMFKIIKNRGEKNDL